MKKFKIGDIVVAKFYIEGVRNKGSLGIITSLNPFTIKNVWHPIIPAELVSIEDLIIAEHCFGVLKCLRCMALDEEPCKCSTPEFEKYVMQERLKKG